MYGLTEIAREQVKGARLLANPGCYPTCSQLPLYPLVKAGLITTEDILIDAKVTMTLPLFNLRNVAHRPTDAEQASLLKLA